MVVIKLCHAIHATPLDNDEVPGKIEEWPLDKESKRVLKGPWKDTAIAEMTEGRTRET